MKRLMRKFLAPLAIAGAVSLPAAVSAQESSDSFKSESFVPRTYITSALSLYRDRDTEVRKRYGPIFGFGARVTRDIDENFRWEAGFGLSSDNAEEPRPGNYPLKVKYQLSMLSFEGTAHYTDIWSNKKGAWYTRAGFILSQIRESGQAGNESDEVSNQGLGLILGGGISFLKDKKGELFGEINYRSIASGGIDLSGAELVIGYRKSLGK